MRAEDLRAISAIGEALWSDKNRSYRLALETLTAISTQDLTSERMLERTSSVLLGRAQREGRASVASGVHDPFYRLAPDERLILIGLYREKWSYDRLSRVTGYPREQVAEIAWAARVHLGLRPGMQIGVPQPTGSKRAGVTCPEYHPARPWTQSFLDEELAGRERVFLQSHIVDCEACRDAVNRARRFIYSLDPMIPVLQTDHYADQIREFEQAMQKARAISEPGLLSFWETIKIFVRRPESLKWILACLVVIGIWLVK